MCVCVCFFCCYLLSWFYQSLVSLALYNNGAGCFHFSLFLYFYKLSHKHLLYMEIKIIFILLYETVNNIILFKVHNTISSTVVSAD